MNKPPSHAHALIIGVDDYSIYDHSVGSARSSNLLGSVNNAAAWVTVLVRRGFAREHIHVLASPRPGTPLPAELAGATPATRTNLLHGLKQLREALGHDAASIGFVAFSGHGDFCGGRAALCPSDTSRSQPGDDPEQVVLVEDLLQGLGPNVTVVLDCCHAGRVAPPASQNESMREAELEVGGAMPLSLTCRPLWQIREAPEVLSYGLPEGAPGPRVLAACGFGGVAFQAEIAGRFQGAFTWALTSALGQWRMVREHGVAHPTLSCATARDIARKLLDSLMFGQKPELYDAEATGALPFFGPAGATSATPDGWIAPGEMPPNLRFAITPFANAAIHLGAVLTIGQLQQQGTAAISAWQSGTEYWSLTSRFLKLAASPAADAKIDVTAAPFDPSQPDFPLKEADVAPMFSMPLATSWKRGAPGKGFYFSGPGVGGRRVIFGVAFEALQSTGTTWKGTITWYQAVQRDISTSDTRFPQQVPIPMQATLVYGDPAKLPDFPADYVWWATPSMAPG